MAIYIISSQRSQSLGPGGVMQRMLTPIMVYAEPGAAVCDSGIDKFLQCQLGG